VSTLLALMLVSFALAPPGLAQQRVDDPAQACPEDPPPAEYSDRDRIPDTHRRNVDCVTYRGPIVLGYLDGSYRPTLPVPRDQMASFVARTVEEAGFALPEPGADHDFDDIEGNVHEHRIRQLAAVGVVAGGPEDLPATMYGPRFLVRRDQMASLLLRAAEWALGVELGDDEQRFTDVPERNPHFRNVNGAHEWGLVVGGTGGLPADRFNPAAAARRDQMASFLARLLAFLETSDGTREPTPEPCEPWAATTPPSGITVELTMSSTDLAVGEPVTLQIEVRNGGSSTVRHERGAQEYDLWVTGSDGTLWVWSYNLDAVWPDVLVHEEFEPGESQSRTERWEQEVCGQQPPGALPAGTYVARGLWATMHADGSPAGWWSNPVAFTVEQ
jgi:hypothetical protein